MNKFFKIIFVSIFLLGLPVAVLADTPDNHVELKPSDGYGIIETVRVSGLPKTVAGSSDTSTIVGNIIGAILGLVGIIFFALTLYAGVYWMTARGDSARVDTAKNTLESAIIGLIIVVAAYAIVSFVFNRLGVTQVKDKPCLDRKGLCTYVDKTSKKCSVGYTTVTQLCGSDKADNYLCCIPN